MNISPQPPSPLPPFLSSHLPTYFFMGCHTSKAVPPEPVRKVTTAVVEKDMVRRVTSTRREPVVEEEVCCEEKGALHDDAALAHNGACVARLMRSVFKLLWAVACVLDIQASNRGSARLAVITSSISLVRALQAHHPACQEELFSRLSAWTFAHMDMLGTQLSVETAHEYFAQLEELQRELHLNSALAIDALKIMSRVRCSGEEVCKLRHWLEWMRKRTPKLASQSILMLTHATRVLNVHLWTCRVPEIEHRHMALDSLLVVEEFLTPAGRHAEQSPTLYLNAVAWLGVDAQQIVEETRYHARGMGW